MAIKMFISYSTKDIRFVERIELLLSRKFKGKIEPVISAHQKKIGAEIPRKIIGNIEECKWFLALLTRNSISNPTVMHELGYANALFKSVSITRIIPVVERNKDDSGRYVPIDTGVFFNRNIESAKYIAEEARWDECISDIAEYLINAYEQETRPTHEVLEERAEHLSAYGYSWEAAENNRLAGKELINQGEIEKGIEKYRKAIQQYIEGEYYWEAAEQYYKIAKVLEKSNKPLEAANEYRNRADMLSDREEYAWEAAKAYEKAGVLFAKGGDVSSATSCYKKAVEFLEQNGYDSEANAIRKRLQQLR